MSVVLLSEHLEQSSLEPDVPLTLLAAGRALDWLVWEVEVAGAIADGTAPVTAGQQTLNSAAIVLSDELVACVHVVYLPSLTVSLYFLLNATNLESSVSAFDQQKKD
jgi:hypothetical protein